MLSACFTDEEKTWGASAACLWPHSKQQSWSSDPKASAHFTVTAQELLDFFSLLMATFVFKNMISQ